jgi:hypothetical protein
LFEAIWTKFEKVIKEIRKQKRRKKKERKYIYIKGPGEPLGPATESGRDPFSLHPESVPFSLFLSVTHGPHMSGHITFFFLRPVIPPEIALARISPPLFNSLQIDAAPSL